MEFKIRIEEKKQVKSIPKKIEKLPFQSKQETSETISAQNDKKKVQIEKKIYENRDKLIEMFKNEK